MRERCGRHYTSCWSALVLSVIRGEEGPWGLQRNGQWLRIHQGWCEECVCFHSRAGGDRALAKEDREMSEKVDESKEHELVHVLLGTQEQEHKDVKLVEEKTAWFQWKKFICPDQRVSWSNCHSHINLFKGCSSSLWLTLMCHNWHQTMTSRVSTSVTRICGVTGCPCNVHLAEHLYRISLLKYIETYYMIDFRYIFLANFGHMLMYHQILVSHNLGVSTLHTSQEQATGIGSGTLPPGCMWPRALVIQ